MANKKQLGTITILIEDRQVHAKEVNRLLTDNGHLIMARLGVNAQQACMEHCTGIIALVVKGTTSEIKQLAKSIDDLYGIVAKSVVVSR